MDDRMVHAESKSGAVVLVRYDRQGRWYVEHVGDDGSRYRIPTVHDAAERAVSFEAQGGTIHEGLPGGQQFDRKVAGCRRKRGVRA